MHRGKCLEVPVTPEGLFESSEIGEQEMSAQGIHHVTLIVDDREQASRFYGDVLGMEEKSRGSYTPNEESLAGSHLQRGVEGAPGGLDHPGKRTKRRPVKRRVERLHLPGRNASGARPF